MLDSELCLGTFTTILKQHCALTWENRQIESNGTQVFNSSAHVFTILSSEN